MNSIGRLTQSFYNQPPDNLLENTVPDEVIFRHCPYLSFSENETCYPISIETYLSVCELRINCPEKKTNITPDLSNSTVLTSFPTIGDLYDYKDGDGNVFLNFINGNWEILLKGDPENVTCYTYVAKQPNNTFLIYYIYLYSHTVPYKLFDCLCSLKCFAHKGDIKFNAVHIDANYNLIGVYFGAHGSHGGQYVSANKIEFLGTHPIAYPSLGDHSNYYNDGCHPRIYMTVVDKCYSDLTCIPFLVRILDEHDPRFNVNTMGWAYFGGYMNVNEMVSSPHHVWKDGIDLTKSNNWFKRLFYPKYF